MLYNLSCLCFRCGEWRDHFSEGEGQSAQRQGGQASSGNRAATYYASPRFAQQLQVDRPALQQPGRATEIANRRGADPSPSQVSWTHTSPKDHLTPGWRCAAATPPPPPGVEGQSQCA
eukprot:scaffold142111_cov133-Phaeocystis_antarctica.AAC.2